MLSISIVTYNTSTNELRKCLSSLTSPIVKIIYIVDNSNQQYISDFCKKYPNVIYIGSENVGYGAGHNKALRKALENKELKYHLVLNSDVYFEPSILDKIANYMDSNDDVAQIQPYVTFPNGELTHRFLPPQGWHAASDVTAHSIPEAHMQNCRRGPRTPSVVPAETRSVPPAVRKERYRR